MYGDLVRDSLSLCVSTLRVVLGSSRGWTGGFGRNTGGSQAWAAMPLHVSATHATIDECGGLISARGKLSYRVSGPAALLLPALRDVAGAGDGGRSCR